MAGRQLICQYHSKVMELAYLWLDHFLPAPYVSVVSVDTAAGGHSAVLGADDHQHFIRVAGCVETLRQAVVLHT